MLVLGLLFVLLILVPIAELYVIVQVASGIGVLETIALLILVSIAGAWLVKWQGLVTIARFQRQVAAGKVPTAEIVDGVLIILAGALLLTPGFLSDVVGILFLIPPVRALIRMGIVRRIKNNPPVVGRAGRWTTRIVDVTEVRETRRRPPGGELEP